jgi:N-acyl-D-aspartate/D-glutamate deacylase
VWAEVRSLPLSDQRQAYLDGEVRRRLVESAHRSTYPVRVGAEASAPDYDILQVLVSPVPGNPTVAEVARARGLDPVELVIDLALETDFAQFFLQPTLNRDLESVLSIMRHPGTVMTFSDAGAHVSQIMDTSIQTNLLAYWVRVREAFTFEEATRMITSDMAHAWGFVDRGLVREGMVADLNVIDPERIAPELPRVAHDLPAGGARLIQKSSGIRATIVAGEVAFLDGEHAGALAGRLLRNGSSARPRTA